LKILNTHSRIISQPKAELEVLLETLSTEKDKIWPSDNWPKMKFNQGIKVGTKGGHGPIRYTVEKYNPTEIIQFRFTKPEGFHGIHVFEITAFSERETEIKHTIAMNAKGMGLLKWVFAIRSLHNALIEDAFDKMENNFPGNKKFTKWNIWVKLLRNLMG
jgi:hypothetical protein